MTKNTAQAIKAFNRCTQAEHVLSRAEKLFFRTREELHKAVIALSKEEIPEYAEETFRILRERGLI